MDTCTIDSCDRDHWGHGYCRGHLARVQRHGDPQADRPLLVKQTLASRCSVEGCLNQPHAKQLCSGHLTRLAKHGDVLATVPIVSKRTACLIDGCERKHEAHGYCRLHGRRIAAFGQVELPAREPLPCAVRSCGRVSRANGYCNSHNERLRLAGDVAGDRPLKAFRSGVPCDLAGCDRPHYCLGFCVNHYQQRVTKPRRRALEKNAAGDVTAEKLAARIAYYGGRCWMCRAPWTCIDHVKPLSKGGSNWPANLRPACTRCNASKHDDWPVPTQIRKAA